MLLTIRSEKNIELAAYSERIFFIYNGEAYGFVDEEEIVSYFQYDFAYPFSQGLSCVSRGGKYGFINTAKEVVIPLSYDRAVCIRIL